MKKINPQKYGQRSSTVRKLINRSGTVHQLPQLKNQYTPRSKHANSTYLTHISKQIGDNIDYSQIGPKYLSKQQVRLNTILKQMNDDTVKIIQNFSYNPQKKNAHKTTSALLALHEKQSINNQQILSRYQNQINKLVVSAEKLQSHDKQYYEKQINELMEEISIVTEVNHQIKVENQRRGKTFINNDKLYEEGYIRKIETDKYICEHKHMKLKAQNDRVRQQIETYAQQLKQIHPKYLEAQRYLKQQTKNKNQMNVLATKQKQYSSRKIYLENYRKKNQFYNVNNQYKYYLVLRKLDGINNCLKEYQQSEDAIQAKLSASREYITKLQHKLQQIRRKKQERQNNLNQFLSRTNLSKKNRQDQRIVTPMDNSDQFENLEKINSDLQAKYQKQNQSQLQGQGKDDDHEKQKLQEQIQADKDQKM